MNTTERINPMDLIKKYWPNVDISHIEYNPHLKPSAKQYYRAEQCRHDGTVIFTTEMMQKCLAPIINKQTYFKPTAPSNLSAVKDIKYTIGMMRYIVIHKRIKINCGYIDGQIERVKVPIICEYITK